MKILAVVNDEVHQNALKQARAIGDGGVPSNDGLKSILDDEVSQWVTRLWDSVEEAITRAYRQGSQAAAAAIEQVNRQLDELLKSSAKAARQVQSIIAERLHTYLQQAVDGALRRVRATINIGGQDLMMRSVTVEQKVNVSTSIKMSLTEICEFVADGEITLSAEYARP